MDNKRRKNNMTRIWRPYVEAKAFVHTLGFKNRHEWKAYCRSGQRPQDIPTHPESSYKRDWKGWGDFLGTGNIASFKRVFLSFEEARAFVHTLGLQDTKAWERACATGAVPVTIPRTPQQTYHTEWQGFGDWLGSKTLLPRKREFLPFEEARTFVHSLGLHGARQWSAYCRSGARPSSIPAQPHTVYSDEWKGWGDYLGTGHPPLHRPYRSFEEARTFVRSLGLQTSKEWAAYCASGRKPANIPSRPGMVYGESFAGMGDWLGTGRIANYKRVFLPFEEARAFARSLGLKTREEWDAFYETGQVPLSIPKSAQHVYHSEFRGWWDWLGVVHQWKKTALIALLEGLQPVLPLLSERELYVILQQGGALPALRIMLGETAVHPLLQQILTQEEHVIQTLQSIADDKLAIGVQKGKETDTYSDEIVPEVLDADQQSHLHVAFDEAYYSTLATDPEAIRTQRREQLRLVDHLAHLPGGLDDEAAEYLITYRVSALWEIYSHEGQEAIDSLLREEEGDQFFSEIKRRFLAEVEAVERLDWTEG
jgi:rhodanese-related sulfurtransferase